MSYHNQHITSLLSQCTNCFASLTSLYIQSGILDRIVLNLPSVVHRIYAVQIATQKYTVTAPSAVSLRHHRQHAHPFRISSSQVDTLPNISTRGRSIPMPANQTF
jgi:hypothetical protein